MNQDQEREKFEAWAVEVGLDHLGRGFGGDDDYAFVETRRMWVAWQARAALEAKQAEPARNPLSDGQIEKLRQEVFSTNNPFCPCDSKTMKKAVQAAERAHGIK